MMPVRWLTKRSRTRCRACRSSWSAVLVATNFMVGRCTASAIASVSRKSSFCPFEYGRTHLAGICGRVAVAQMMRADADLHANQARRQVGKSRLDLAIAVGTVIAD